MKQKYVALKMYLVGLTVGLFILGWSAVANNDAVAQTNTAAQTASSTVTTQTQTRNQQSVVAQPSTVLVFKDGHKAEVENYAIVGTTLFDFGGEGRTRKIRLADLDLTATQKVNDERGVDFHVPASGN